MILTTLLYFLSGLSDITTNPCPIGHYCPEASEPYLCPPGTMRPIVAAANTTDCFLCTSGYYCPNNTINIRGIPCNETFECPLGSPIPSDCRPGLFCPTLTGDGLNCTAGYYCPNATGANPYICDYPTYCPQNSNMTLDCPLGYMAVNHPGLRVSLAQSCRICPGGTYGNHPQRLQCDPCQAGYYCPEGTPYPDKYPCPKGYYCPAEIAAPRSCPAGTYGKFVKAKLSTDCALCPANTYTNSGGQSACKPCGSSATSTSGGATCVCIGAFRAFQTSDGACRCKSGYMFYDEADRGQSDENSDKDCQSIVVDRCTQHQIRLASSGVCVDPTSFDCQDQCSGASGQIDETGR